MNERVEDIIPDARCREVHGKADFGASTPREVLNGAVLSYALGFTTGYTAMLIAREHGLITKPRGYKANLTDKGKRYARAMVGGNFAKLCAIVGAR